MCLFFCIGMGVCVRAYDLFFIRFLLCICIFVGWLYVFVCVFAFMGVLLCDCVFVGFVV